MRQAAWRLERTVVRRRRSLQTDRVDVHDPVAKRQQRRMQIAADGERAVDSTLRAANRRRVVRALHDLQQVEDDDMCECFPEPQIPKSRAQETEQCQCKQLEQ